MALKKISLAEQAYLELTGKIINGTLPAGTPLTEEQLAEEFAISRTPVREALRRLAEEGLVEPLPSRGFRVRRPTTEEIRDLYECRARIETLALELALPRIPDELLQQLSTQIEDAARNNDRPASLAVDEALHLAVADYCSNAPLAEIVRRLIRQTAPFRNLRNFGAKGTTALEERCQLVTIFRARNIEAAKKLLADHIRQGASFK